MPGLPAGLAQAIEQALGSAVTNALSKFGQQQELTAPDGGVADEFGYSVALSNSGQIAVVGAPYHMVGTNAHQGAVYLFTKHDNTWTEQQELTASGGAAQDYFGYSVAVDGCGQYILIGAPFKAVGKNLQQGAAYIFTKSGGTYTQRQELTASDGAENGDFGLSVALDGDGNIALIGGRKADAGAAYVFTVHNGTWVQHQELTDGQCCDGFGGSVALNYEGNIALIGAPDERVAYIFTESGGSYTQHQKLYASDSTAHDLFGASVALNYEGNIALIGAPYKAVGTNSEQGAAYVFTESGSTYTQQQELTASDGAADDLFGSSVALNYDGKIALIGAPGPVGNNFDPGAAYIFAKSGSTYTQQQELKGSDGEAGDLFGWSVALDYNGNIALIGAPFKTVGTNLGQGTAYIFTN